jgi:lipid-A-disaccharide synthase
MTDTDLFIFAGESSGDLLGQELMKALPQHVNVAGVGGPKMRSEQFFCVLPMEEFRVMGFVDVFFALPKLAKKFFFVRDQILKINPKAVLFIDYAEFNIRMAESLRKKGFKGKLCHFVCPSVWAWGKGRIPRMASSLDLLLTLLPFEPNFFSHTSLKTCFVGHPLTQRIKNARYDLNAFPEQKKLISIFPGSRKKEILRNFPRYLRVAKRLSKEDPSLSFAVSISHESFAPLLRDILSQEGMHKLPLVPPEKTYDLMKASHLAIAKSGTVTLELALHGIPTVVTYAISTLDLFIARSLLRIKLNYYCLVNIIQDEEVFPELFGPNFTEENLYQHLSNFLGDEKHYENCKEKCLELSHKLSEKDPMRESAQLLGAFL